MRVVERGIEVSMWWWSWRTVSAEHCPRRAALWHCVVRSLHAYFSVASECYYTLIGSQAGAVGRARRSSRSSGASREIFHWLGSSGHSNERLGCITTVSGQFLVSGTHCSWFFACLSWSRILLARCRALPAASFFVNSNRWPPMFQHLERFGRGTRPILKR